MKKGNLAEQILICSIGLFENQYNVDIKIESINNGKIIASSSLIVDYSIKMSSNCTTIKFIKH